MDDGFIAREVFASYWDAMVHSPGLSRLDVYGTIGQSCDGEQRVLRITEPDGTVKYAPGDLSGILEVRP